MTTQPSPWLHRWALFTAGATFVLLFLGSLVTTLRVGMADPIWPTYPWHLALIDWSEPQAGYVIEHTHRAAGYAVGCCMIVLTAGLLFGQRRRGLRILGLVSLGCIIWQGMLGGVRVLANKRAGTELAIVHGCFAQIVFGLTVSLAVVTSRRWLDGMEPGSLPVTTPRLRGATLLLLGLVYLQIVLGAVLRHTFLSWGPRGHLLVAFGVVAATAWVIKGIMESHRTETGLLLPALALGTLVTLQVMLGVETWMMRYVATAPHNQLWIRTAHLLVGSLVWASAVVVALQARRRVQLAVQEVAPSAEPLEGAA